MQNMQTISFKKKIIATAIASLAAGMSAASYAQTDETIDEVVVTGIKASLSRAMDIKREAAGVVDAISAEDMGKMPDTNLAESMQRITGVSIDRSNGEGSKVTVRGFGPDYNLVTLNGRQMPTSELASGPNASTSRSFDFGNLASETVSGVEVYKTGRANINSGGIGATINISTARPLNNPGLKATVGVKGVMDQSTEEGDDITPEISGLFSQTFADDKLGVALSGSYQERDSGNKQANVASGWRTVKANQGGWGAIAPADLPNQTNFVGANSSDIYSVPQAIGYSFNEIERTRTNGQLVLQFKPVDALTTTLDYTYAKNEVESRGNDLSAWFGFGNVTATWTDGPVSSPLLYSENTMAGPADFSMGANFSARVSEIDSVGFNAEFEATEHLKLELDAHSSTSESRPNSAYGSENALGTAAFIRGRTTVDFSKTFPAWKIDYAPNTSLDPARMLVTGSRFTNQYVKMDIDQYQLKGAYSFDDSLVSSINFGVGNTNVKNRTALGLVQRDTWGGNGSPGDLDASYWPLDTVQDKFTVGGSQGSNVQNEFFKFDFDKVNRRAAELYGVEGDPAWPCGKTQYCAPNTFTTDLRTEEETAAAYLQANLKTELGGLAVNVLAGIRYEETDVTSQALVPTYSNISWVAANEFSLIATGERDFTTLEGNYNNWLPSVDFDIELREDLKLRASASTTLARPSYSAIQGGLTVSQGARIDGGNGSRGNPDLLPLESKNFDVSAEWYYDDANYLSVGYFHKDVENFIGTSVVTEQLFDLPHPGQGARYDAAVAALGSGATPDQIRAYIVANTSPGDPSVDTSGTNAIIYGIPGQDPASTFKVSVPVNQKSAMLKGMEFAWQHNFGDSGFGTILNHTIVDGDVNFNNYSLAQQFALFGLSDSSNLIAFYDKNGIQVRLAYNWRDEFLAATQTGNGNFDPIYVEAYGQWDINASYEFNENFTVFVEGVNVSDEYTRTHSRRKEQVLNVTETGPRYNIGARYTF